MALVEGAPFLPHSFISNFTRTYIQPTCHFACFLLPCLSALVWAIVHTITSFLYKKDGTCALPTKISNCLPTRISQIIKIGRKNIHPTRHHIFIHTGIALFKDLSVLQNVLQSVISVIDALRVWRAAAAPVRSDLWEEAEWLMLQPETHLPSQIGIYPCCRHFLHIGSCSQCSWRCGLIAGGVVRYWGGKGSRRSVCAEQQNP